MAEHPNVALARKGYEAFGRGDMETIGGLFADDIMWHEGGKNPLSGDYKGKDAVFGMFGRILELTGGTFKNEVHTIVADDEHAAVMTTISATIGGRSWSGSNVDVIHIRDGKVTEFWDNPTDRYGFDEFLNG